MCVCVCGGGGGGGGHLSIPIAHFILFVSAMGCNLCPSDVMGEKAVT